MLPMPPMIEAMIPLRMALKPIVGSILVSREISIPAAPAKAEPMAKTDHDDLFRIDANTLAPIGSSATARMALPSFVFWIRAR